MEIYQYKDEKEKLTIEKIFKSSILARRHTNVYIDRSNPTEMICSQILAEELLGSARLREESIHIINSTGYDLSILYDHFEFLKGVEKFCVSLTGAARVWSDNKGDLTSALADIQVSNGRHCILREQEVSGRLKLVEIPVFYNVTDVHLNFLKERAHTQKRSVDACACIGRIPIHPKTYTGNFNMIKLPKEKFGKRLCIPYDSGFTGPSISEYGKKAVFEKFDLVAGREGHAVSVYVETVCPYATTLSVLPSHYWFVI